MDYDKRDENFRNRMEDIFRILDEKMLSELPKPAQLALEKQIKKLREIFMNTRPPRFAIIGRRGAGKSSLVNAIFGKKVAKIGAVKSTTGRGKWFDYKGERATMSILDTRGLGEGSRPDQKSEEESSEKEVKAALDQKCPDALLFLCKAKETDARIKEDLKALKNIQSHIQKRYSYEPLVMGIITQVDELDPIDIVDPPYEDPEKQENIKSVREQLSRKLLENVGNMVKVIPTSAYVRFDKDRIVYDRRWNIEKLSKYLIGHLPNSTRLEMARITQMKSVQKKMARIIVGSSATLAGGVGTQPIPAADLPIITGIQVSMIIGIGYISGREMNKKTATEFMTSMGLNVGSALAFRELARALVKLIPVAGNVVSGGIAAAATWGIGEAAIAYFIDNKSSKEAKQIYKKETEKKKKK